MGQPCLILLRPAPSAVLVRDRGAVARVFSAVLEVSEHAPCRAPPRARAWRGRRGLALSGARVGRWPGRIVNGEWRVTRRDQGSGIMRQRIAPFACRYSLLATRPSTWLLAPGGPTAYLSFPRPFTDSPA